MEDGRGEQFNYVSATCGASSLRHPVVWWENPPSYVVYSRYQNPKQKYPVLTVKRQRSELENVIALYNRSNTEYDHNIFNPRTRRLRERAKTMEDIAYFLVGRKRCKNHSRLLPMQPTLRIARIQDVFDKISREPSTPKYLPCFFSIINKWKGKVQTIICGFGFRRSGMVVERRGCEKVAARRMFWGQVSIQNMFKRLLLSPSTHEDFTSTISRHDERMHCFDTAGGILYCPCPIPGNRRAWTKSAVLLMRSELDLKALRQRVQSQGSGTASKYSALSIVRLQALAESGFQELLQRHWVGEDSKKPSSSLS
ncbi:hypothetical protein BDZ97DRAFT_1759591 [Flammula alnicola]|nr:hypothetical protein BDZ97DRAFT_1759591 [Flammula alnicola]